jgi:hypothetical protein
MKSGRKTRIDPQADFDAWSRNVWGKESARRMHFLKRFGRFASVGGATDDDVEEFRRLIFEGIGQTYRLEYLERYVAQIEPYADAARKVRSSRFTETQLEQRSADWWPVIECARDLMRRGEKRRGLAAKIEREIRKKKSVRHYTERQINRILTEVVSWPK